MTIEIPAEIACLTKTAPLPQIYEEAKKAIAECARLDECAGWADKAAAIASYARQADDFELEAWARRIRDRAARRCGELLRAFDARGGDRSKNVTALNFTPRSRRMVAHEAGLSEHKARTAVNIAAIPEAEFEAAVESKRPPGTTLLSSGTNCTRASECAASPQLRSLKSPSQCLPDGRWKACWNSRSVLPSAASTQSLKSSAVIPGNWSGCGAVLALRFGLIVCSTRPACVATRCYDRRLLADGGRFRIGGANPWLRYNLPIRT